MHTLFPIPSGYPEGFIYVPEFLTNEEEENLIRQVAGTELHNFTFQGFEAKRKVASFGYDYNFDRRSVAPGKPIPPGFHGLVEKVASYLSIATVEFTELLVTEYPAGSVINWHRDAPPFELIAGISLLSDCDFRLRPHHPEKRTRASVISVPVQRRSLYIIKDVARSEWQHSIAPVKDVRYSITLRTLRKGHIQVHR